jgi:hypothetical protein
MARESPPAPGIFSKKEVENMKNTFIKLVSLLLVTALMLPLAACDGDKPAQVDGAKLVQSILSQVTFADTLTGCVKKLKKAFDFSNIAIMNAPPSAAPASDGLYIDAINLKLYIAAGGMWFTMNLSEYQI